MKMIFPMPHSLVTQPFGANPSYYARFLDANGNPEKGHMGIDFSAAHGAPVFAVHDGFAFYVGPDSHGGDGIYLRFEDEENPGKWYTCIYWHLNPPSDPEFAPLVDAMGRQVKQGDLLGYADNSGAPFESTGDHLHFGLVPCDVNGNFLDPGNGYGGCIDPAPFLIPYTDAEYTSILWGLTPQDRLYALAADMEIQGKNKTASMIRATANLVKAFEEPGASSS
jgi:murein DD-endopeptidase MepM/ murein hydrolase activator NlpD